MQISEHKECIVSNFPATRTAAFLHVSAALLALLSLAFRAGDTTVSVLNVRAEPCNGKLEVTYDLEGSPDCSYDVRMELCRRYDSHVKFVPGEDFLKGDIGRVESPGKAKKIEWRYSKELGRISGGDFYVKVYAGVHSGVSPLAWVVGGALLVWDAYLVREFIRSRNPPPADSFPTDPGRP